MRKIQSCINMDSDNLDWLRKRKKGISGTVNDIIGVLRNDEELLKQVQKQTNGEVKPEVIVEAKKLIEGERKEKEIKVRAYFEDNPHIVYMAKTQRRFKKADLCRIKEDLYFSKYNVDVNTDCIKKVLRPLMDSFDVDKYQQERGLLEKVK